MGVKQILSLYSSSSKEMQNVNALQLYGQELNFMVRRFTLGLGGPKF